MTRQTRQLAAIMFTDIQGYTALMQKDEKLAVSIRVEKPVLLTTPDQCKLTNAADFD